MDGSWGKQVGDAVTALFTLGIILAVLFVASCGVNVYLLVTR